MLDAPNEDSFFEALHASWVVTKSHPEAWSAVDVDEFPAIMQRIGIA